MANEKRTRLGIVTSAIASCSTCGWCNEDPNRARKAAQQHSANNPTHSVTVETARQYHYRGGRSVR